jgi:hypothetical protein
MHLPRDGAEHVHITLTMTPPDATLQASVDNRTSWFTITERDEEDKPIFLALGPDYSGSAAGHRLQQNETLLWVRAVGNPETVVRSAGIIRLI